MSVYRYCYACGEQMGKPTAEEAIAKEHLCSCGQNNSQSGDLDDFLIELWEQVQRLESSCVLKETE